MKTVEQLVIGETADFQLVVGKTTVNGFIDSCKRYIFFPIFKDGMDAGRLFFYITQNVQGITFFQILLESRTYQVEILVEDWLYLRLEIDSGVGRSCRMGSKLDSF